MSSRRRFASGRVGMVRAALEVAIAIAFPQLAGCRDDAAPTAPDAASVVNDGGAPGDGTDLSDPGPFGTDCPPAAPSSVPVDSPRILILGPAAANPVAVAAHLQAMLAGTPGVVSPLVTADVTAVEGFRSLMTFFYFVGGRAERLAALAQPWSHVVLLEDGAIAHSYPELYFEGVRVLGCAARAAGAIPIVLEDWTDPVYGDRPELTYRVANGTSSVVAPAGTARDAARRLAPTTVDQDLYIAAATLYGTLTGRSADTTGYRPAGIQIERAAELAIRAHDTVVSEASEVHYQGTFSGVVHVMSAPAGEDFWFMASGSSSEHIWFERMNEVLPRAGQTPQGTEIGSTNPSKIFDDAALAVAAPHFQQHQYRILLARQYSVAASTIATVGGQHDLQVQVWDRHFDFVTSDGASAIEIMEYPLSLARDSAQAYELALIPYHLMFAKLKTMRPSVQLLADGVHVTYPVGYGLATMSVVSRTGWSPSTSGLDVDTQLAARLGDETIRQLATLSVTGVSVADDPSTRPNATR